MVWDKTTETKHTQAQDTASEDGSDKQGNRLLCCYKILYNVLISVGEAYAVATGKQHSIPAQTRRRTSRGATC